MHKRLDGPTAHVHRWDALTTGQGRRGSSFLPVSQSIAADHLGWTGAQGGQILGIYYGVTRSERYGALVGQSEDWTTLQVYIHGMDGIDWNTSRLLRAQ